MSLTLLPTSFRISTASGKLSQASISPAQMLITPRQSSTRKRGAAPGGPRVPSPLLAPKLLLLPTPSASTRASIKTISHTRTVKSAGKQFKNMHNIQRGRKREAMSGNPRLRDMWAARDTRRWFTRRDTTCESTCAVVSGMCMFCVNVSVKIEDC